MLRSPALAMVLIATAPLATAQSAREATPVGREVSSTKTDVVENLGRVLPGIVASAVDARRHFDDLRGPAFVSRVSGDVRRSRVELPGALETFITGFNGNPVTAYYAWNSLIDEEAPANLQGRLKAVYQAVCAEVRRIFPDRPTGIKYNDENNFELKISATVTVDVSYYFRANYKDVILLTVNTEFPKTVASGQAMPLPSPSKPREPVREQTPPSANSARPLPAKPDPPAFKRDPALLQRVLKQTWKGTYTQPYVAPDSRRQTLTGTATLTVYSITRNDDPRSLPGDQIFEADYAVKMIINGTECAATSKMRGSVFLNHDFTLLVVTHRYTYRSPLPGNLKWDDHPPTGTFVLSQGGPNANRYRLNGTLGTQKETAVSLTATVD